MASWLLSIASYYFNPAETINAVRAWGQHCEVLQTYQGMEINCHFQVWLEVKPKTAMGRWHSCPSLKLPKEAQVVLLTLMHWDNLKMNILLFQS